MKYPMVEKILAEAEKAEAAGSEILIEVDSG